MYVPIKKKTRNCGTSAKIAVSSGSKRVKRVKRRKTTERGRLEAQLDKLWGKRIKAIWQGKCAITGNAGIDPHHFFGKKACPATRWDLDNGIFLAKGYHRFTVHKKGVTEPAREAIIARIGIERFNALYARAFSSHKHSILELEQIRDNLLMD